MAPDQAAEASEELETQNDDEAHQPAAAPEKAASNEEATETTPDLMKVVAEKMTSAVEAAKEKTTELVHTAEQVRSFVVCWWHQKGPVSYYFHGREAHVAMLHAHICSYCAFSHCSCLLSCCLNLGMHLMQAVKSDKPADSHAEAAAKPDTDALEPTEAKEADALESARAADPVEPAKASPPLQDIYSPVLMRQQMSI